MYLRYIWNRSHGRTIYEIEIFEFDMCSLFMNLIHAVYEKEKCGSLEVWGPSEPRLLVGEPSGLLTSDFRDIAIWFLWRRTEEFWILVVGWNQRNVLMCTPLINMVHISGTLIYLVQRTMRSKVSPGLRIYTEEPPSSLPAFCRPN